MGTFWDAFVFRVWAGLGERFYPGYRDAARLLESAYEQGLLPVPRLNDLSILLIVLTCPSRDAVHRAALEEYTRRQLTPVRTWTVLREALPPHLTDVLLWTHFGEPRGRAVINRTVGLLYLPALVRFLARLALIDYAIARAFAVPLLDRAVRALDYEQIVQGDLLCALYGRVAAASWPIADRRPDPPPSWVAKLSGEESAFLNGCFDVLAPAERCLLYLSFYGRLNAADIACLFGTDDQDLKPRDAVDALADVWERVLQAMARRR